MTSAPSYTALQINEQGAAQISGDLGIALNNGKFSISAWIQYDGYSSNATIIEREGQFEFRTLDNGFFFQIEGNPPLGWQSKEDLGDDWICVCLTYDNGSARLYVNGVFQQLSTIGSSSATSGNPLIIGSGLQGLLKSVIVYNTALSASQVTDEQFTRLDSSLIAAYFDFSQNPPVDTGPKALPITLNSGAASVTVTPCMRFQAGSYIYPMHDGDINPGGQHIDPYTIQAWVYVRQGLPVQYIMANSDLNADTGMSLQIVQNSTNNNYYLVSKRGSDQNGQGVTSTTAIEPGTWTNVATTFDGSTLNVYVNGTEAGSVPAGPIPLSRNYGDVVIGATFSETAVGGINALRGCLSHLNIWDIALTAAQISQYQSDPPQVELASLVGNFSLTASPPHNAANGHPVGLTGGARIYQHILDAQSPPGQEGYLRQDPLTPVSNISAEKLAEWRESIDFKALLTPAREALPQAREQDAARFSDDDSVAKIHHAYDDLERRIALGNSPELPLIFTRHEENGRRYLVGHKNDESFIVYDGDAATIDDCTLWKIQLIFVVFAGALDALVGVKANLSSEAQGLFARFLNNPSVAAILAQGTNIKVTGLFSLMSLMVHSGQIKSFLWACLDVGIWTFIRIVGRLVADFVGIGAASVVASLAATVVTFIATYAQRPSSCDPLPAVTLANIKFNHDPSHAAVDALSIRQNASTDITPPEWRRGFTDPKQSPVAYAIDQVNGKTVTIQVAFTLNVSSSMSLEIQATGGGILGAIDPVSVSFNHGASSPQYVTLNLPHHQLANGGVQAVNAAWTWQFRQGSGAWQTFATSNHRIFTLLSTPTMPWVQSPDPAETQLPWVDALEYSCDWASGKTTAEDVLAAVTDKSNSAYGLKYDTSQGASFYTGGHAGTINDVFYLTSFLKLLGGGAGNGHIVNCTDCATIVTTFANLLGTNVQASVMKNKPSDGFDCNKIQAIGYTTWAYPFGTTSGHFAYHEVAWLGNAGARDNIFDACLKLDSSNDPWNWASGTTHTPVLPVNFEFTSQPLPTSLPIATPFTDQTYRERLATNDASGIGQCKPVGQWPQTQSGRRAVV